jgi:peptidoglycan/LPS O-acetylase OafA/YrhL
VIDLLIGMGIAWVVYTLVDSWLDAREKRVSRLQLAAQPQASADYLA